jgi:hypothetical protein
MPRKPLQSKFLLCIKNEGYAASLEVRKVYQVISDSAADKHHLVRVIDESGEDYLYPQKFFVPVELPTAVKKVFAATA